MTQEQVETRTRAEYQILFRDCILEQPGPGKLATQSTFQILVQLQTHLNELAYRALKDVDAIGSLYAFAIRSNHDLWQVCERRPDLVGQVAETKMVFPCAWPMLRAHQKKVTEMMLKLGVGQKSAFRLNGRKQFDPDLAANWIVQDSIHRIVQVRLQAEVENNINGTVAAITNRPAETTQISDRWTRSALALKNFSVETAEEWAKVIWEGILTLCEGKPEQNPVFRPLGLHRAKHSEQTGQQARATNRTKEANIRDGIKARLLRATRAIAGKPR